MADPWTRNLRDWYRRSSPAERTTVAARRLSADLTAVIARSGIVDGRRAVSRPPVSRPGQTPDDPATAVPVLVFPARSTAAPPPYARPDADETVGPAVAPVDVEDIGAEPDAPAHPEIPLLGCPETYEARGDTPRGTMAAAPGSGGDRDGHLHREEPGRWLPLRDALQAIGSLEHLYQLARDGRLQSREETVGRVEVWVTDRACFGGIPARRLEFTRLPEAVGPGEPSCSEAEHQVVALAASLIENHERHLELARENGALGERVAQLERQIEELTGRPAR